MAKNKPMTKSHASKATQALRQERRTDSEGQLKSLARIANQRLARLEKFGLTKSSNAYRYLEKRHFDRDTMLYENRSGKIRFTTKVKGRSAQQLQHEIRELERFLYEAKTSTVSGTNAKYTKAFNTYKSHFEKKHPGETIERSTFDALAQAEGFATFVKAFGSSAISDLIEAADDPNFDLYAALAQVELGQTESQFWANASVPILSSENSDDYDDVPFDH